MSIKNRPFVPGSIERAKRIAKEFKARFPNQPLSQCQASTAHLLGHKDWHALAAAIQSGDSSAPHDEALDFPEFKVRRTLQREMICLELGGIDPAVDFAIPAEPPTKPTMTHHELAKYAMARSGQQDQRLKHAHGRWALLFAEAAIDEIRPTTASRHPPLCEKSVLTEFQREDVANLAAQLSRWWSVNIDHQPEVGATLAAWELNADLPSSLLSFSQYWGTLCMYYARTINWALAMGTAYLLADRYAEIRVQQSAKFEEFLEEVEELAEDASQQRVNELLQMAHHMRRVFLSCYPRDDFADAYSKQPGAFREDAREAIRILANPVPGAGTWDDLEAQDS